MSKNYRRKILSELKSLTLVNYESLVLAEKQEDVLGIHEALPRETCTNVSVKKQELLF